MHIMIQKDDTVVDVYDIYEEDPNAWQNFLKWLWDHGYTQSGYSIHFE